jgi:hypothetical protein
MPEEPQKILLDKKTEDKENKGTKTKREVGKRIIFGMFGTLFTLVAFCLHDWTCWVFIIPGLFCLAGCLYLELKHHGSKKATARNWAIILLGVGLLGSLAYWSGREQIRPLPTNAAESKPIETAEWQPPELPPGCSNVVIWFGGEGRIWPVSFHQIPISPTLTKIPITNLPPEDRIFLSKQTGYTRRIRDVFGKVAFTNTVGGKIENYPVTPNIISNRLYVDVVMPFLNERRTILMDYDYLFNLTRHLPEQWDFNFNSDSNVFEIVNESTNPVLQVIYKAANEVQVNGIFFGNKNDIYVAFNHTPALFLPFSSAPLQIVENQTTQTVTIDGLKKRYTNMDFFVGTNEVYDTIIFTNQKAIFKYPAIDNPGKFAK